jgi:hypothetical protein
MKTMTEEEKVKVWFEGEIYDEGDVVTNPLSGESCKLNNIELSLYDYIMGVQICYANDVELTRHDLETYECCIDYFLDNNIDAYMKLLD